MDYKFEQNNNISHNDTFLKILEQLMNKIDFMQEELVSMKNILINFNSNVSCVEQAGNESTDTQELIVRVRDSQDNLQEIINRVHDTQDQTYNILHNIDELKIRTRDIQDQIYRAKDERNGIDYKNQTLTWLMYKKQGESLEEVKKRMMKDLSSSMSGYDIKQQILLIIMKEIDRICRDNELTYWLNFGSLLGAVRNKGFIPWDDDIDISMMRKEFLIFRELIKDNKLIHLEEYYSIDVENTLKIYRVKLNEEKCHLFVDIFLMDYCEYNNKTNWKKHSMVRKHLVECTKHLFDENKFTEFSNSIDHVERHRISDKDSIKEVENAILYSQKELTEQINVNLDDGSGIIWGIENNTSHIEDNIFKKSEIFPLMDMPFMSEVFFGPFNYKLVVERLYGDIYDIPRDLGLHEHLRLSEEDKKNYQDILNNYC